MAEATKIASRSSAILKQGEFGYPNGHLGHLTESQESALVEFEELCAKNGLYTPAKDGKPPSHEDGAMLRFLRARRFIPQDALGQFKDTEKWREVNQLDKLYMNIDVENFEEARRLYPQWTGRRDKRGLPVFLFHVKPLDSKTMAAYAKSTVKTTIAGGPDPSAAANAKPVDATGATTPPRLLRVFALYEYLATFMVQLCTSLRDRSNPETPITQSNNIVDISGVGLKQFWNLRGHMQDASVLATAHYPETLDRIFIVGAPAFFPTVWSWIKRWFDPITVSKIFILSHNDVFRTLSTFIDLDNIPKKYGGNLHFDFGEFPTIDPAYADRLQWKYPLPTGEERRWPKGPMAWQHREDGAVDLLAVGSVDGKPRRETVATLLPEKPATDVKGLAEDAAKLSLTETAEHAQAPPAAVGAAVPTARDEPETIQMPVEQKVDPVPLDAIATELPKPETGTAKQLLAVANGEAK